MRALRAVAVLLVGVALVASVVLTLTRQVLTESALAVLLASFAPLALLGYGVAALGGLGLLRRARRRAPLVVVIVVSLLGCVLHAAWLAPDFRGGTADGEHDLTVLTLNIQLGRGDLDDVAALLRDERPEVAVLTEVTPEALRGLEERGVVGEDTPWPHLGGRPRPGPRGTVVLSAWELRDEVELPLDNSGYRMQVLGPRPFTLSAVHPGYPLTPTVWRDDLARLASEVREVRELHEGPHVMVGDFNATQDHAAFRAVLDGGVRDAAEQAGSGWQPTWPTPGAKGVPGGLHVPLSVLRLDHVLVSPRLTAVRTRTAQVAGADHFALTADLAWTR